MNHPNSISRELALKFLYQCQIEKIHYFSNALLEDFIDNQKVAAEHQEYLLFLAKNTFDKLPKIDAEIEKHSKNWKISRMSTIDKSILRIGSFEIMSGKVDKKIVINEAVELAKQYGAAQSGSFVNGILDSISSQ